MIIFLTVSKIKSFFSFSVNSIFSASGLLILLWQTIFFSHYTILRLDDYFHYWPRFVSLWHVYYHRSRYPADWNDNCREMAHYQLCRYYIVNIFRGIFRSIYYYNIKVKRFLWYYFLNIYGDFALGFYLVYYTLVVRIREYINIFWYVVIWRIITFCRRETYYFVQADFWKRLAPFISYTFYDRTWGIHLPYLNNLTAVFLNYVRPLGYNEGKHRSLNLFFSNIKIDFFDFDFYFERN